MAEDDRKVAVAEADERTGAPDGDEQPRRNEQRQGDNTAMLDGQARELTPNDHVCAGQPQRSPTSSGDDADAEARQYARDRVSSNCGDRRSDNASRESSAGRPVRATATR